MRACDMIPYGECDYDTHKCVCMDGYVPDMYGGCTVKTTTMAAHQWGTTTPPPPPPPAHYWG